MLIVRYSVVNAFRDVEGAHEVIVSAEGRDSEDLFELCWILEKSERVHHYTVHSSLEQLPPSRFGWAGFKKWEVG